MNICKKKLLIPFTHVVLFLLMSPSVTFALGVGDMQLESTLNQRLDARIEIIGVQDDDLSSIIVDLAPKAIFERMGIEQSPLLKKLRFSLENMPDGTPYVQISTNEAITEPFLNFLIELNWRNGRLLREFTVLLDPPVLLDEKPSTVTAPLADLPPTFTVTTKSNVNDALKILKASNPKPKNVSENVKTVQAKPNMSDVFEEIIAAEHAKKIDNFSESTKQFNDKINEQEPLEEGLFEEETAATAATSLIHEEVRKNEILWRIADQMRPENISVEQMMLALKRENPNAFYEDNVSFLKAGAVLRIDDTSTLNKISVDDAVVEISRQHQDWLDYRNERLARNAVVAESVEAPQRGDSPIDVSEVLGNREITENNITEPRLTLVSPIEQQNEDAVSQTNAVLEAATEKLSQLHIELAIAGEAVEAGKHENEELLNRLSALEEQMSAMQSLIQLKDSELQRLQGGVMASEQRFLTPVTLDAQAAEASASATKELRKPHHEKSTLFSDPITVATAILVVILLALLGWVIRGRRTKIVETEELVKSTEKQKSLDELFPEEQVKDVERESDQGFDAETTIIKFNETKTDELTSTDIGLEPLTEINFEHTEMLDSNESLLDPIAEADVYLTYEKYSRAEELLQEAVEIDPDRQELKLKLLEVYALSRNIENFDRQAEELFIAIGGSEENPLWQHAQLMAKDISTNSPLFFDDNTEDSATEIDEPPVNSDEEISTIEKAISVSWSPEQVTEFDAEQELAAKVAKDFSNSENVDDQSMIKDTPLSNYTEGESTKDEIISDTISKVENSSDESAAAKSSEQVKPNEELTNEELTEAELTEAELTEAELTEAELTEAELTEAKEIAPEHIEPQIKETDQVESVELKPENAKEFQTDTVFDKNWDETNGEEVNEIVNEAIENAAHFSTKSGDATGFMTNTSMFLLSDEVGTKLDLAKAYIEMGDQVGAFDLLGEVLEEGTSQQKNEAQELMESS